MRALSDVYRLRSAQQVDLGASLNLSFVNANRDPVSSGKFTPTNRI